MLVVSDLHLDCGPDRLEWLTNLIEKRRPKAVLSLGDLGDDIDWEEFTSKVMGRTRFYAIYGNHDDVERLASLSNFDGSPVLLGDGEVVEAEGLRLGFVNGVISLRRRSRRGVPRKKPWEFAMVVKRLAGRVDVLCMHEFPAPDELLDGSFPLHAPALTAREAVLAAKPKAVMCGHIHYYELEPKLYRVGPSKLVILDSSSGAYAAVEDGRIELLRDGGRVFALNL